MSINKCVCVHHELKTSRWYRKDFGIDIDMPLETGGAVVGDKVTITLEVEALRQG